MCHYAKFMRIGRTVLEIWPIFSFTKWRPSAILDFQKLEFFKIARTLMMANMRHRAKFCEDRSNRSGDMDDF